MTMKASVDVYQALETLEAGLPQLERDEALVDRLSAIADSLKKQPAGSVEEQGYKSWASQFGKTTGGETPMDTIVHNPDPSEQPEAKPTVDKVPSTLRNDKVGGDRPHQTYGPMQPAAGTKTMNTPANQHTTLSGRTVNVAEPKPTMLKAGRGASRPSMNKGPKRGR